MELLDAAARKRIAFTSFVGEDVIGNTQGAKPVLPVVIAAVPALVKALVDAGVAIWKEYRPVSTERRKEIVDQLNGLKWRAFADIATQREGGHEHRGAPAEGVRRWWGEWAADACGPGPDSGRAVNGADPAASS